MGKADLEKLIENESEWRRYIINKVDSLDSRVAKIEGKVLLFSTIGGGAMGLITIILQKVTE